MYSIPRASRASATYRSRSPWVTKEPPRHFLTDPVGAPLGVRAGEERGQPVPRQFPGLVGQPEPLHPRLGAERLRHDRVQDPDAPEIEERARVLFVHLSLTFRAEVAAVTGPSMPQITTNQ